MSSGITPFSNAPRITCEAVLQRLRCILKLSKCVLDERLKVIFRNKLLIRGSGEHKPGRDIEPRAGQARQVEPLAAGGVEGVVG